MMSPQLNHFSPSPASTARGGKSTTKRIAKESVDSSNLKSADISKKKVGQQPTVKRVGVSQKKRDDTSIHKINETKPTRKGSSSSKKKKPDHTPTNSKVAPAKRLIFGEGHPSKQTIRLPRNRPYIQPEGRFGFVGHIFAMS